MDLNTIKDFNLSVIATNRKTGILGTVDSFYKATDDDFSPIYSKRWRQIGLKYVGTATKVIVPDTYHGQPIESVSHMFEKNTEIEAVVFPNSAKTAIAACRNCPNLKMVTFGTNMVNLREACYGCYRLEMILNMPKECLIMDNAFAFCASLKTLPELPKKIRSASGICQHCNSLKEIEGELPPFMQDMSYAFLDCSELKEVPALPKTLWNIDSMFQGCTHLSGEVQINYPLPVFDNCFEGAGCDTEDGLKITGDSMNLYAISKTADKTEVDLQPGDFLNQKDDLAELLQVTEDTCKEFSSSLLNKVTGLTKMVQHSVPVSWMNGVRGIINK